MTSIKSGIKEPTKEECNHTWWVWKSMDDVPKEFRGYNRLIQGKAYTCPDCGAVKIGGIIIKDAIKCNLRKTKDKHS